MSLPGTADRGQGTGAHTGRGSPVLIRRSGSARSSGERLTRSRCAGRKAAMGSKAATCGSAATWCGSAAMSRVPVLQGLEAAERPCGSAATRRKAATTTGWGSLSCQYHPLGFAELLIWHAPCYITGKGSSPCGSGFRTTESTGQWPRRTRG